MTVTDSISYPIRDTRNNVRDSVHMTFNCLNCIFSADFLLYFYFYYLFALEMLLWW